MDKAEIHKLILEKFERQYRNEVGLSEKTVNELLRLRKMGLDEVSHFTISFTEKYLNYNFKDKQVLIVGGGLSPKLTRMFFNKGAKVYVIEPDENRIDVQFLYARLLGIPESRIIKAFAENLPFDSNMFDFVYCCTVLEHVQDVKKSLSEMYRVAKKNGVVFIETPDFRVPHEPHYKITFPYYLLGVTYLYACLPGRIQKLIVKLGLTLLNRPTKYLNSINFLNEKYLKRIFMDNKWRYFQLHFNPVESRNRVYYKFHKYHQIEKNLWFYIFKE